jgi:hypothetical protein
LKENADIYFAKYLEAIKVSPTDGYFRRFFPAAVTNGYQTNPLKAGLSCGHSPFSLRWHYPDQVPLSPSRNIPGGIAFGRRIQEENSANNLVSVVGLNHLSTTPMPPQ